MRIRKDTNFSANHNKHLPITIRARDVCGYAKILIFLQITTGVEQADVLMMMYADTQRY